MPFKPKTRKTHKSKKGSRPRKARTSNVLTVPKRGRSTIADRAFVTMTYSESVDFVSTVTPDTHVFQTSIHDPDATTPGGIRPLGYDQWNGFYESYRVHGIKWEVTFINTSTTTQATVAVMSADNATGLINNDLMWTRPYTKNTYLGVEGSGQGIKKLHGFMSSSRSVGMSKPQYKFTDDTRALFAVNPAIRGFLHFIASPISVLQTANVTARIRLTYYCELTDRVSLTGSAP